MRLAAHAWRIHGKVRRRYSTDLFFSSISFDFAEFSSRSPLPFHPLPFPIRHDFVSPHLKISPRLNLCTFRSFFSIRRILSTFCLPFEIYSSNLFINTERESFLYLLFQLDRFVRQINEKCFILATFILSS